MPLARNGNLISARYDGSRMLRRVFTVLSFMSLLLCVARCMLWVRSYFRLDTIYWLNER
ncbi:MAG: hypothetical protein JWP03_4632 [Phycisphaerales bacterium]|jgi:hypothetical protein|nr:hypothetical protein [Phycisphaerales bacterium]